MYTGSCLCGGIRFRITSELEPIQVCHCTQCRKAQGTALATNIPVRRSAFHWVGGAELLTAYESSTGKQRTFCRICGSPVYSTRSSLPDVLRVRAGLLNEPLPVRPVAHFYTETKANWWNICDKLPQYAGAYTQEKSP